VTVHRAAIPYRNGELEAREQDDAWTVRLANLKVHARYLDVALAQLLGNVPEAHRVAARLLSELSDVVEQQETAQVHVAPARPREHRRPPPQWVAEPVLLGLRMVVFVAVVSTAFMLTTWLSTFR
jgi:hypothetical protein